MDGDERGGELGAPSIVPARSASWPAGPKSDRRRCPTQERKPLFRWKTLCQLEQPHGGRERSLV